MVDRMTNEVVSHMKGKTTEELLAIWTKHDLEQWSGQAFEAIRQILVERGVELPQQDLDRIEPAPTQSKLPVHAKSPAQKRKSAYHRNACILFIGVLWLYDIENEAKLSVWHGIDLRVMSDIAFTSLIIGTIAYVVAAVRIKPDQEK
jgi:hypothetical protein